MKLPASIEVYHAACMQILGWMSSWLPQDEFDRLSREQRPVQGAGVGYTLETILLPLDGDPNLALLHEMQAAKIVRTRVRGGRIEYMAARQNG